MHQKRLFPRSRVLSIFLDLWFVPGRRDYKMEAEAEAEAEAVEAALKSTATTSLITTVLRGSVQTAAQRSAVEWVSRLSGASERMERFHPDKKKKPIAISYYPSHLNDSINPTYTIQA